ncbi:glycoside hydrolase family 16 protein [Leifsonia sp. ZF2019]|uniref:glycoside hydrolase family 16 protein n=1 Tax=Leifsonia sp. ZF2019 TaxID=2781978 RepID=UPI001CC0F0A3|nr:glycoside hydrolase family 16 protein [Leifsonia sp. ZF2019]UAJ80219.1 glycoside hydrolase family 16 protein [Leifsonia sp. ZF2019]
MPSFPESLPDAPNRRPDIDDDFRAGLSPQRWVASYLPQWTTAERARAHYEIGAAGIVLRIDADQPDWRPEDAPLRVSNLQTGVYSGPVGSRLGTHRHREDLEVRTETPQTLLFAPSRGRVEITASASRDAGCMLAAWLVGTEHRSPSESGEICIFEIDADAIGETTVARTGIKAHHDPGLATDMAAVVVPVDASSPHTWTVVWHDGETVIGCDGHTLRRIPQAPDYPLFLMIDLFEIGTRGGHYPKTATIHRVRAWQ